MTYIVTKTMLQSSKTEYMVYFTYISDGHDLIKYVLYDSSEVAGLAERSDSYNCSILQIDYSIESDGVNKPTSARLWWDATTDVLALTLPQGVQQRDFRPIVGENGLPNIGGVGKTGDILLDLINISNRATAVIILKLKTF